MNKTLGNPKVSVIIPVYNMERFLPDAVNSALGQSFQDFEIIIVDDSSTDSTLNVANGFAKKDKRVIVLMQEHKGTYAARNFAIIKSRGEYIAMLDADDIWEKDHLKDSIAFLDKNPDIPLVFSRRKNFAETPDRERKAKRLDKLFEANIANLFRKAKFSRDGKFVRFESPIFEFIIENYPITNSTKVMRKDAFVDIGMYANVAIRGDAELAFRFSRKYKTGFIDAVGARYRLHGNNLHERGNAEGCIDHWILAGKYDGLSESEKKLLDRTEFTTPTFEKTRIEKGEFEKTELDKAEAEKKDITETLDMLLKKLESSGV